MIKNWWKIINGIAVDVIVADDEWIASLPDSELWSDEPNCIGCAEIPAEPDIEEWIVEGRTITR
jgi:hypothetical protein